MEKKQYLNEEKYQKTKKMLITIGCISIAVAIILLIICLNIEVPGKLEEGWYEAETRKSAFGMLSFVFGIIIPLAMFGTAYGRNISAFNAQQTIPVTQETIEKMAPSIGKVGGAIAKEVGDTIKESNENQIYCKHCGSQIDEDSKFCKKCGKEQ